MTQAIVGVIRGGTSNEYDLSLKTGAAVIDALPEESYHVRDIFIDKGGAWHMQGRPVEPARALTSLDVVFNALHGGIGEDGTLVRMIRRAGVPYVGAEPDAYARTFNKVQARRALRQSGIRMPNAIGVSLDIDLEVADVVQLVFSQFGPPYVVKPAASGFSDGVRYAASVVELADVLNELFEYFEQLIVEEFVRGREITVGMIDNFRDVEGYVLPPAEVACNDEGVCITARAWREGLLRATCPVESHTAVLHKEAIIDAARKAHRALGLAGYSSADFIVTSRGPYLLEVDALPPLYEGTPLPAALDAIGASLPEFIQHTLTTAAKK